MRTRITFGISLLVVIFLLTSCNGLTDLGPTSTPDPWSMDIVERTIWDFENIREELNDLEVAATDTPVEDLEPILQQMQALNGEINGYEFPLFAAQAQSALLNFAWSTEQCYFGKYAASLAESSRQELMGEPDDRCDQVQVYEETLDLYLQELKEMDAGE